MWVETTKSGKFKFTEQYRDSMTGKNRRVSVTMEKNTAATRKTAAQTLARIIEDRQREPDPPEELTLAQLIDKYRGYQKLTVKESTYTRNYYAGETLKAILGGDVLADRLTPRYIRESFVKTGKDPGTLNEHRKRLISLINWAYENDYIPDSQYVSITKKFKAFKDMPHREKIEDKYLEPSELTALLAGMDNDKWRFFTKFLVLSGLRTGEAIALEMDDFDFSGKYIHVTKTYDAVNRLVTAPKTSHSIRDVYMQPQLEPLCRRIITNTKNEMMAEGFRTKLFICDRKGRHVHYYAYNKYLRENAERILGRTITPHALRHTHASLLLADGVIIDTIARRLGHENSRVTREIYLHVTKKLSEGDNEQLKTAKIEGI